MMAMHQHVMLCQYGYDPLDRWVSSTSPTQASTQRFYQKSHLATEIQGSSHTCVFQYGDLLLAEQGAVKNATRLLATDQQRSVITSISAQQYSVHCYTPYGHRRVHSGLGSLLGFNGGRPDPITGHYLLGNGHRAYNPILMRFNSPDSLSPFSEGGINCYAYCLGDPINHHDPTGYFSMRALSVVLKAVGRFKALRASKMFAELTDVAARKIYSYLPHTDLVSLASTSSAMKNKVYGSLRRLSFSKEIELLDSVEIQRLRDISLGKVKGHLPAQVHNVDEYMVAAYAGAASDTQPGKGFLREEFIVARRDLNDDYLRAVNARERAVKLAHKKKAYGEDIHRDTSYDSDSSYN